MLVIENLPLYVEARNEPANPVGIPNTHPFILDVDARLCSLYQKGGATLSAILDSLYEYGSTVGHAMDDSGIGSKYAEDFLDFVLAHVHKGANVLEVGAGRGYLAARMKESGLNVTALEPGGQQSKHWSRFGVEVIKDRFPSLSAKGPYDAIIFYGVLEHIADIGAFLSDVRTHLVKNGLAILSVPDCTDEIYSGDPSILLHEHYHYFTRDGLRRVIAINGFCPDVVQTSGFGRSLFAVAAPSDSAYSAVASPEEEAAVISYEERVYQFRAEILNRVMTLAKEGKTLGIYCPGRALALLPESYNYRFFDDSPSLHGLFYPPFGAVVETRENLISDPTDVLWIMTRTFESQIRKNLVVAGFSGSIVGIGDLIGLQNA